MASPQNAIMSTVLQQTSTPRKALIMQIAGGLGNQLFQYAYGLHLSQLITADLFCDIGIFTTYRLHSYMLGELGIPINPAIGSILAPINVLGNNRYGRFLTKRALHLIGRRYIHVDEKNIHINPASFSKARWIYLQGYWQRHDYLTHIEKHIRRYFRPKKIISTPDWANENTVGIHIRRGDYAHTDCLPAEYYSTAYAQLSKLVGTNIIPILFSNDPDWTQKNIRLSSRQIVCRDQSNLDDFFNMSRCRHQIIANSTFSWWAAWLNENPEKTVVAPRFWPRDASFRLHDLIPENWSVV